jgi:PIN domain nuclease of toxin-antitoxin system
MRRSLMENNIRIADLSPEIAVESTHLAGLHRDPADQIIAATSRVLGMPLVTADQRMLQFLAVETIWQLLSAGLQPLGHLEPQRRALALKAR